MKKTNILILIGFFCSFLGFSAIKTFNGPGIFSNASNWSGGSLPVAGDDLFINGACTFDNAANNLAYGALSNGNTSAGTINWPVSGTNTLSVTDFSSAKAGSSLNMTNGGFLQIRASWSTKNQTFTPGIGTIIWNVTNANSNLPNTVSPYNNLITATGAFAVSFGVGGTGTIINNNLTVSTGTLNSGNNSYSCGNTIYIISVMEDNSNAGNNTIKHMVINLGGRLYSTIGETYSISGNLTMLGGNISGGGIPILNVAGNFLVLNGTNDIGNSQLAVTGTTSLTAALNISTTGGTKTLKDLTVTSTGSFNCAVAESWSIGGNITVNGSFNANAGTYSLTGSGNTISGSTAMTFSNVTCTGTYTNNANVSLTSSLIGLGTWSQGTTGVLNLAILTPSFSVTNFSASAIGNTVNYSLSGNQTIRNPNDGSYYHLSASTSATKTFSVSTIIGGNMAITSSTLDVSISNFNLSVGGNWVNTAGTFVPRLALVTFNGLGLQTIFKSGGEIFNNITFSNTGNKSLLSAINGNTLTINAGSLTANSNSITLTGNWTNNGGTFVGGTGTVLFTAATPQTIFKASGETFNDITFLNAGTKSLLSAISCNTLTINTTALIANNNNITVTGDWANNTGLFTPGTNTVLFTGISGQTIFKSAGEIFNNITFSNTGNKSLLSAISGNTLTINAGSLTANSNSITLTGNWTNNGGTFAAGAGTVFFTGTTAQSIFKASGETFNNITLLNPGNKTLLSAISGNTLTINATTLTANSNSITLIGNWANNAGNFVPGTGTTLFTGTSLQTIFKLGGETFHNITFSNTGNKTLLTSITGNTLTINSGSLTAGIFSITLAGNWTNNGGTFLPGTGTTLFNGAAAQTIFKSGGEIFNNLDFSNTGTKTLLSAITGSNVLINSGSNLNVNTTNNQISVRGNFTNSGTFNAQNGLVLLNGSVAQVIGGTSITDFYNLTLNNSTGANLTNAENLINTLTLSNGTFNTNAKVFTMISTSSNTARIAQIAVTADIIGNVTVQRFAPGGTTGWALLGTPISSALTFQDWDDNMPISCNSCPDGSAAGFLSIYSYDETAVGSYSVSNAYVPLTAITDPIIPNKGYWVYLGNGQTTTTPIIIDVTGTVRKFNNVIPLTATNTGSAIDDGWNLIHNPYPSPINWSSLRNGNTNVDNAIYGYNTDLNGGAGGSVASVNGFSSPAVGAGGISDTIPMCQGFQVHCTANTNLTAQESNKVAGNPTFLKINQSAQVASTQQSLRLYLDGPTSFHDETALYIQPGATNGFDSEYDAIKMAGQDPNAPVIMLQDSLQVFQINGISPISSSFLMPLKTITGYTGTYTISAANISSFPTGACISLYDTYNSTTTNLKTSSYVFILDASTINPRFILNITINPLDITTNLSQPTCVNQSAGQIIAVGNTSGPWNYSWKDVTGTILKTSLNKSTADTLVNLIGGNYSLEINTVGQCDSKDSTFAIAVIEIASAQFTSVDTTYLSNNGMVAFTNGSSNAANNSWNFGDSFGFSISSDPTYNYTSAGIYTVTLIASSNSGCMDTAYKSIVVVSDMTVTKVLFYDISGSLVLKTLEQNEFLISGTIDGNEILNFMLVDGSGKLVKDYGNFKSDAINLLVNLNNCKAGIYYLNITGEKTNKTIKLPVK
ncbi:MAG: PKD domain-containing protein [Burkholderiales bacterium]|nr:PKD domain-containing protein [Bacteroidia bacterium]